MPQRAQSASQQDLLNSAIAAGPFKAVQTQRNELNVSDIDRILANMSEKPKTVRSVRQPDHFSTIV